MRVRFNGLIDLPPYKAFEIARYVDDQLSAANAQIEALQKEVERVDGLYLNALAHDGLQAKKIQFLENELSKYKDQSPKY